MGTDLQKLRNAAEVYCLLALRNGDQDTADAWERIGIAIDDCVKRIKDDLVVIESGCREYLTFRLQHDHNPHP